MKRLKLIKFHSSSELSESFCGTGGSDEAAVIVNAFLQDFWAMHLQAPMHPNLLFLHVHTLLAQSFLHPQEVKTVNFSGSGGSVVKTGKTSPFSSIYQPNSSIGGNCGQGTMAFSHTLV
jgi:hypothetical protein